MEGLANITNLPTNAPLKLHSMASIKERRGEIGERRGEMRNN